MSFLSFLNIFRKWKKNNPPCIEHSKQLSIDLSAQALLVNGHAYSFASLMAPGEHDNSLYDFIVTAPIQDIKWLYHQKTVKPIKLAELFKRDSSLYVYILIKAFINLYPSEEGKKKVDALINWKKPQEVFNKNLWHNPVAWSLNISLRGNVRNLVALLNTYGAHIDLNQSVDYDGKSFFERIIKDSISKSVVDAITTGNWNIKVMFRDGRVDETYSNRYFAVSYPEELPEFSSLQDKERFICEKLYELRLLEQHEAKELFEAFEKSKHDYLQPYLKDERKMAELMLANPDWFLMRELFSQYCSRANLAAIKTLYKALCSSELGCFYTRCLESVYVYHSLKKELPIKENITKKRTKL